MMKGDLAMYRVINPADGSAGPSYPLASDQEVRDAQQRSHAQYLSWRQCPVRERAALLTRVAEIYRSRAEELAAIIEMEMGKSRAEGVGEANISADIYQYYADHAERYLADEPLRGSPSEHKVCIRREPVGSILGIMPWNFPYYQVARFAAPNLVLGNTILLKHAPQCPDSARVMEEIFREAGCPADVYINLYASNEQVSDIILPSALNQGVSLTGSERAGAAVAAAAGRNLKKVVLELGGSDPCIVLDSKDVREQARTLFAERMFNNGQACNAPKRMIVSADIYDEFVDELVTQARKLMADDPQGEHGKLRPLSSHAAQQRFLQQVSSAVSDGARVLAGGQGVAGSSGAYVEPTVLVDLAKGMSGYYDEFFGPACIVFKVNSDEEAVALANDTPYGLGAAVFSEDVARARSVGDRIDTGMLFINTPETSAAHLPFGGVKRSGIGRELGPLAMDEFVNKKLVYVVD